MTEGIVAEVDKLMEQAIIEVAQKEEEDLKKENEKAEADSKLNSRMQSFSMKNSLKNTLSKWNIFDNPMNTHGGKNKRTIKRKNKRNRTNKRLSKR